MNRLDANLTTLLEQTQGGGARSFILSVRMDDRWWYIGTDALSGLDPYYRWLTDWDRVRVRSEVGFGFGEEVPPVSEVTLYFTRDANWWLDAFDPVNADCYLYLVTGAGVDFSSAAQSLDGREHVLIRSATGAIDTASLLFAGYIRDYQGDESVWEVTLEDVTSRYDQPLLPMVTPDVYPRAHDSARGVPIPRPYGQPGTYLPPLVDAGFRGYLSAALDAAPATSVIVCDCAAFRTFPASTTLASSAAWSDATLIPDGGCAGWPQSGWLLAGPEAILYKNRTDTEFQGCVRGQLMSAPRNLAGGGSVPIELVIPVVVDQEIVLVKGINSAYTQLTPVVRGALSGTPTVEHSPGAAIRELEPQLTWAMSDTWIDEFHAVYLLDRAGGQTQAGGDLFDVEYGGRHMTLKWRPPFWSPALPSGRTRIQLYKGDAASGPDNATPDPVEDGSPTTFETHTVTDPSGGDPETTLKFSRGLATRALGYIRKVGLILKYRKPDEVKLALRFPDTGPVFTCPNALDKDGIPREFEATFDITALGGGGTGSWSSSDFAGDAVLIASAPDAAPGTYSFDLYSIALDVEYAVEENPRLTALVSGVRDLTVETIPADEVLRNPVDVLFHLLKTSLSLSSLDVASFREARSALAAGEFPLQWDAVVADGGTLFSILRELLWQTNGYLVLRAGKISLRLAHEPPDGEIHALGVRDIASQSIRFFRGGLEQVINLWNLSYQPAIRDGGSGTTTSAGAQFVTSTAPSPYEEVSNLLYGTRAPDGATVAASAIADHDSAAHLLELLRLRRLDRRPWIIEFETGPRGLILDPGDQFLLSLATFPNSGSGGCDGKRFRCLVSELRGFERVFIRAVEM